MSDSKEVLQFPIDSTEHLIEVVEGLTEIDIDMDVESTPSSISITIYGSEEKLEKATEKIKELVEESKDL